MRIQSINLAQNSCVYNKNFSKISQNKSTVPSFKASLTVDKTQLRDRKYSELAKVEKELRTKLRNETQHPEDVIRIAKCSYDTYHKTKPIEINPMLCHVEFNSGYCPSRSGPSILHHSYDCYETTASPDLEVVINNKIKVGFYYDDRRSVSELAEDFFNTYKHLRYLAHYSSLNEGVYERHKETSYGYIDSIYNRLDKPIKEVRSYYRKEDGCSFFLKSEETNYEYDERTGVLIGVS